jgi:hypothetical protein
MKMNALLSIGSIAVSSIALNLVPVQQAQAANLVLNGNFDPATTTTSTKAWGSYGTADVGTSTTGTVHNWTSQGYNFIVPSGTGIADTTSTGVNFYGTSFSAPNGAAYFIAADGAYNTGLIYQDLTGLEVGQTYSVDFYQSAAQQKGFTGATTDQWIVNVGGTYTAPTLGSGGSTTTSTSNFSGGTTYTSPLMSLADSGNTGTQTVASGSAPVSGWQQDSFAFTATATTERLSFLAKGTPTGKPPFSLLSGVSANKLPEPADYVGTLVCFGFVGLVVKSRLAKKKLAEKD